MIRFKNFFKKQVHSNPAIRKLYRDVLSIHPKVGEIIPRLPQLAKTYREGAPYLLHKTVLRQIEAYDIQYNCLLSKEIDAKKKGEMLHKLNSLMLVSFFFEISGFFEISSLPPEGPYPAALTEALHYEIYHFSPSALPSDDSFAAYLSYKNPNFDDPKMAPAYKFGNDIAAIVAIPDLSFSFMIAQQVAVIFDISTKLMRWVLFDEAIEAE